MDERQSGKVKWFDEAKGYGFITPDGEEKDIFVHYSAIKTSARFKALPKGARVEFDVENAEKGLRAINVRLTLI